MNLLKNKGFLEGRINAKKDEVLHKKAINDDLARAIGELDRCVKSTRHDNSERTPN